MYCLAEGHSSSKLCALQAINGRLDAIEFFQRAPDAVKSLTALVRCSTELLLMQYSHPDQPDLDVKRIAFVSRNAALHVTMST